MAAKLIFLHMVAFLTIAVRIATSTSSNPALTFAEVGFPDTPSVHATLDFVRQHVDEPTLSHVTRSSVFALLAQSKAISRSPSSPLATADTEVIVISGLLHDMSWNVYWGSTKSFISQDKRFEVDGANVARNFLTQLDSSSVTNQSWDDTRLQLVWDAIALHATSSIGQYKQPEVALIGYGIGLDVSGNTTSSFAGIPDEYRVTQEEFDQVYGAIPAPDFTNYLKNIGCWLCIEKPSTTYDNFAGTYGAEWVIGYTLEGHTGADILIARAEQEGIQNFTEKIAAAPGKPNLLR